MRSWCILLIVLCLFGCLTIYAKGFATFKQVGNVVTITEANAADVNDFYTTHIAPKVATQVAQLLAQYQPSGNYVTMTEVDAAIVAAKVQIHEEIMLLPLGMSASDVNTVVVATEKRIWQWTTNSIDAKIKEFENTRLTKILTALGSYYTSVNP